MSTWGLTKAETGELDAAHRKQLREIWNNRRKKNKDVYHESNETPMNVQMKKMRWRAFGHMLRLPLSTPCQQAMDYYFEKPDGAKKFSGRKRMTLPVKLNEDITTCIEQGRSLPEDITSFQNKDNLTKIRNVAANRETWKQLQEVIYGDVQGEGCYNPEP